MRRDAPRSASPGSAASRARPTWSLRGSRPRGRHGPRANWRRAAAAGEPTRGRGALVPSQSFFPSEALTVDREKLLEIFDDSAGGSGAGSGAARASETREGAGGNSFTEILTRGYTVPSP